MIMVWAVIAAVLLGYCLGGRLKYYQRRPLKWIFLPAMALMAEASFGPLSRILPVEKWLPLMTCLEYALLEAFLVINTGRSGFRAMALGTICNFAAIAANGFSMPVTPVVYLCSDVENLLAAMELGQMPEYVLVDWNAPLWFLGDTLPMFGGLASVGDLLMAYGMLFLVLDVMTQPVPRPEPAIRPVVRRRDRSDDYYDEYDRIGRNPGRTSRSPRRRR